MEVLELHWYDHMLFFLTAVVIPLLSLMARPPANPEADELRPDLDLPPKKHLYYQNGLVLIIGAMLVLTAWNAADREWTYLGFRLADFNTWVQIAAATLILFYIVDLLLSVINKSETEEKIKSLEYVIPLNWGEFRHYIFLAFAAGICEEIIFRGFLINYLFTILQSTQWVIYLSILIPAVTFGLSHYYQGLKAVLKIISIAILFGVIFVYSGSLYIVMIIHVCIDLVSGMSAILLNKREE